MLSFFAVLLPFMSSRFRYLDPGPLVDRELELVVPQPKWIESLMAACRDPLTVRVEPTMAATTRQRVEAFLTNFPGGRQPLKKGGNTGPGEAPPAYFYWMLVGCDDSTKAIAGGVSLRIGRTLDLEQYLGHYGCHVYPPFRGHHYAERAGRLLLPLAKHHGINPLWITCNPDNLPSRRTCERLGAELVEIVSLPVGHPLREAGDRRKCRYKLDL
jgi:tagatose 1,6-diphosphate aldolase